MPHAKSAKVAKESLTQKAATVAKEGVILGRTNTVKSVWDTQCYMLTV